MADFLILVAFIGACMAAGLTGALFEPGPWYRNLSKPRWTPPNLAFPIVWTALYVLMGWAAIRVAGDVASGALAPPEIGRAVAGLGFWALQMTLNAVWSPIFFGLHKPRAALGVIVGMSCALLGVVWGFAAVDPIAAAMMVPTMIWGLIATALNASIWRMNPASAFARPAL
jgi:tryptophan-rich sensory protein